MKKLLGFSILLLSLVLFTTSCTKKDDVTPTPTGLITLGELQGNWNFVSYQLNGKTYTNCAQIADDNATVNFTGVIVSLDIQINVPNTGGRNYCTWIDKCNGTIPDESLTLDAVNNKISLDNGITFQIVSYKNNTLVLKLLAPDKSFRPAGGIYTLNKS